MDGTLRERTEVGTPGPAAPTAGAAAPARPTSAPNRRGVSLSWPTFAVVAATLGLTAVLSVIAFRLNRHNEHRLLDLQVKQTATVLQALVPSVETPLASAAEIAASTGGSAESFRSYIMSSVGKQPLPFVSASLWRLDGSSAHLIANVGEVSVLSASPRRASAALTGAAKPSALTLVGPLALSARQPRLGYLYAAGDSPRYVVYAESKLPAHRRAVIQPGSPFADLRFALYLGRTPIQDKLLETNANTLPLAGDMARVTVPFGSSALTLVAGTTGQIGGGLSGSLWWVVIIVGVALAALAGVVAERLVRQRRAAEGLTEQTTVLLAQQRSIAQTLQHALLPETLPSLPGLLVDARYITGADDVDIGGDWYDLLPIDEHRVFFVIGDVSGRGLRAGTTMASLRFAMHALVSEGHPPEVVLDRLAKLIDVAKGGQFATVLCGVLDRENRELCVASAGHPPLLLVEEDSSRFLQAPVGPPIGVPVDAGYRSVTVGVRPGVIVLAFTDGLVERRDEAIDVSLERLRSSVGRASSLDQVFDRILPEGVHGRADDIAVLGLHWLT